MSPTIYDDEPIATCMYGWGKRARFYQDEVVLHGRRYELTELVRVRACYHRFFGISSARLSLNFQRETVVLRGIAEVQVVRQIVAYLAEYIQQHSVCVEAEEEASASSVSPVDRVVEGPQLEMIPSTETGQFWEYDPANAEEKEVSLVEQQEAFHDELTEGYAFLNNAVTEEQPALHTGIRTEEQPALNSEVRTEEQPAFYAQAMTEELPVRLSRIPLTDSARWRRQQDELQERRRLRLQRLSKERSAREHGFDVLALALCLRTEPLPVIEVSVHMMVDEVAHYCTEAMLCGELLSGTTGRGRSRYRIKDQGTLILTNRRVIYLGRQRQISLSYEYLHEVIHTHHMISFLMNNGDRRQRFEVPRPLEVTMYLECILQRNEFTVSQDGERTTPHIIPTATGSLVADGQV